MEHLLELLVEYIDNVNICLNEFRSMPKWNQAIYLKRIGDVRREHQKDIVKMKKGYSHGLDTKIVTLGVLGMLNWVAKWYKRDGPLAVKGIADIFYGMIPKKLKESFLHEGSP